MLVLSRTESDDPMAELNRRDMVSGLALMAGVACAPAVAAPVRRPNILFALADDWSWQSAIPTDQLGLNLPNFERVRREGLTFDNAFVAAPSCTTSRGSILTGRAPWQLEEGSNLASILPAKFGVYPDLLEAAGYQVGLSGKGWAPGQLGPVGRQRNPAGPAFKDFAAFMAGRKAGAPFCFWLGSNDPHRPYKRGIGRASGVKLTGPVPPYLPDTDAVRIDIEDYMWAAQRFDSALGEALKAIEAAGELSNTLVVVTGDNGWAFPRGKATLYDAGTHVPLAMMWPDRIRPGRVTKAMVSLTDLGPTFVEAAGLPRAPDMTGVSLIPLMTGGAGARRDVVTAMERHMDGHTIPGTGYPMRALRTDRYLYIRNFHPERWPAGNPARVPASVEALETDVFAGYADIDGGPAKAWLATHHADPAVAPLFQLAMGKRPARELYDVQADPFEMRNLAADPAHAKVVAQLDDRLMAELRRLKDPRVLGPDNAFDYPSYSDPGFGRPPNLGVISDTDPVP